MTSKSGFGITTRQQSWGKVMFSLVSISHSVHRGRVHAWSQVTSSGVYALSQVLHGLCGYAWYTPSYRWYTPLEGRPPRRYSPQQTVHPLVLASSGGNQRGRHASYWNAFLLHVKTNTIHNNSYLIQTCCKQQLTWNIPIADSSKLLFIKLLIPETEHSYIVNGDFSLQIPEYWQLAKLIF